MRESKRWLPCGHKTICRKHCVYSAERRNARSHNRITRESKVGSLPCQAPNYLILPHLDDPTQHPPVKLTNPSLASSPLVPISSISSKFLLPQKSFTPLTNRLLIFSTSGSSTAAKQIRKYAQLRLSLISSVGANMEPGATSTRYFSEVKWIHSACESLAGATLLHKGWEGKLSWTLTSIRPKTLPRRTDTGDIPYEHASERPCKFEESDLFNDTPLIVDAPAAAGLDQFFSFFENRAHGLHPALITPTKAL